MAKSTYAPIPFWFGGNERPPRKSQIESLEWFKANSDKKYIFLELPVGVGKSLVGLSIAQYYSHHDSDNSVDAYILTPQKILQAQYEQNEGSSVVSLYGKRNYKCATHKTNCEVGASLRPKCGSCPHKSQVLAALGKDRVSVLNYALALSFFSIDDSPAPRRKTMVFDECHTLENHLVEFSSLTITVSGSEKAGCFFPSKNLGANQVLQWVAEKYLKALDSRVEDLAQQVEAIAGLMKRSTAEVNLISEFNELLRHYEMVIDITRKYESDPSAVLQDYVFYREDAMIKFKPLFGKDTFGRLCEPYAEKFVFLSATVFDHRNFCTNIGIDYNDAAFLAIPSEFEIDNRPVIYDPACAMTKDWDTDANKSGRTNMLSKIKGILEFHESDKGIIHTANHKIAQWLSMELSRSQKTHRVMCVDVDGDMSRDETIEAFMEDKRPTVLISPSITEGLDLKHDLARFAIFAKVPYGNLGDPWIRARFDLDKKWYAIGALTSIVQGCGRVVRAEDDWGISYILDSSWERLLQYNGKMLPTWWRDALLER